MGGTDVEERGGGVNGEGKEEREAGGDRKGRGS